jgi:hypothetical protein
MERVGEPCFLTGYWRGFFVGFEELNREESPSRGEDGDSRLVYLVWGVCFVYFVVGPNKPKKPDEPDPPPRAAKWFIARPHS